MGWCQSLSSCFAFVLTLLWYLHPYIVVDGGWNEWSQWTVCSSQCERQRTRECNSPIPRHRGKMCEGNSEATENCTDGLCTQSKAFLSTVIIIFLFFFPNIIIIIYTLTITWQVIASVLEEEVWIEKEATVWTDTDSQSMIMSPLFLLYTAPLTCHESASHYFQIMFDVWNIISLLLWYEVI